MPLPNPGMTFVPFDILTAAELNDVVENVESLAAGTGLDDSAVTTAKILNKNVTTPKMKPTYYYVAGSTGGARQAVTGTSWTVITGASQSYTSGATTEVLLVTGTANLKATSAGSQCGILVGGVIVSRTDYTDSGFNNLYHGRTVTSLYEIAANTTVTIAFGWRLTGGGTGEVANGSADVSNLYSPSLSIIAFAR